MIKTGETVITSRAKRVPVTVASGAAQGSFAFVEEGIVVPARYARDYEIEVGLGGSAPREKRPGRRAKRPAEQG